MRVSVCGPLFNIKAGETEERADKGDQRTGLGKTDKGACHHFFNEQLDPISRGQQWLSKSPSLSVLAATLSAPSISVHNPADFT